MQSDIKSLQNHLTDSQKSTEEKSQKIDKLELALKDVTTLASDVEELTSNGKKSARDIKQVKEDVANVQVLEA